jgi:hypothetical protein
MPAPSTPEACNLHCEALALIEQAAEQAESSASRIRSRAVRGMTAALKAKGRSSTRAAWRDNQPTRAERGSGSGSLMRTGRPGMATPVMS